MNEVEPMTDEAAKEHALRLRMLEEVEALRLQIQALMKQTIGTSSWPANVPLFRADMELMRAAVVLLKQDVVYLEDETDDD